MKKVLLFLSLIVAAVGCTNDLNETPSVEGSANTISVNVSTCAPDSRVDFTDDTESGDWIITWNIDDQLSGFSVDQTITYSMKFTIEDYGATSSTFTGSTMYYSDAMRFVYPYNYNYNIDKDTDLLPLSLAEQSLVADYSNLSSTTFMVSNEFDVAYVDSSATHTEESVYMSHVGAAIELKMKFANATGIDEEDYTISQIIIGSDEAGLPIGGDLSIDDASFTTTKSGAITLNANDLVAVDGIYTSRFNVFPTEDITGTDIPVEVTLYNANNEYFTATTTITAAGELDRATNTTLYVMMDELTAGETPDSIIEITSETIITAMGVDAPAENGDDITITDADFGDFTINSNKGTASTNFRVYNSSGDLTMRTYAGNLIIFTAAEGKAITSITFSTSSISSASVGRNDGKTWTGDASEVTLTMAAGTNTTITITYNDESDTTDVLYPEIVSLSPDNLILLSSGGTAYSTIIGYDLSDDTDYVYSSSENFDIDITGTTITVTADANSVEEVISETIYISIAGDDQPTFELTLSQEAKSNITLVEYVFDATDIKADSELGNNENTVITGKTYTVGDVTLAFDAGPDSKGYHSSYDPLRSYGYSQLIFSSDKDIMKVVFDCYGSYTMSSWYANGVSYEWIISDTENTWSGSTNLLTLYNTSSSQTRWYKVTVYVAE